ncbi:unnamed protein product [Linum trigynum]|uniref:Uncharacterized protein n=1 Tax=Linum trigynum TaxID=586398 RepID=A0AAV2EPW0_9ROSI
METKDGGIPDDQEVGTLLTSMPVELLEEVIDEEMAASAKERDHDFLCKGYILNGLVDDLYDYYANKKNTTMMV